MKLLPKVMAFIDTETTGLNPRHDRIIEIGIIRVEEGRIVKKLDTVVHPRRHIPQEIFLLTGICKEEILRAPDFDELKNEVREILEGAVFTAHNARFDYAFVKHEFGRFGDPFGSKVLCTVKLTRKLFPKVGRYSLESLITYFGLNPKVRHRAYADAEVLWRLYNIALENHGEKKVSEAVASILKTSSLPAHLPREVVDGLPESPGIYMFYGEDTNLPLYVGKSINIKDRVKSHFSSDYQNTTDLTMASQIKRVEAVITAGEIGALVREADTIKTIRPVYNKKLRQSRGLICASLRKDGDYNSLFLEDFEETKVFDSLKIMAVYRSKKNAKESLQNLVREYNLCPRLLGLEKGKDRCFASQIGICHGACTKEEEAAVYNNRFIKAFNKSRVKKWPFKSAIVVKEESINRLTELHFVDKWMYLGSVVFEGLSDDEPKVERYPPHFDWDIYKILAKTVLNNKNIYEPTKEEKNLFFTNSSII